MGLSIARPQGRHGPDYCGDFLLFALVVIMKEGYEREEREGDGWGEISLLGS